MKKNIFLQKRKFFVLFAITLLLGNFSYSQKKFMLTGKPSLKITGTSSLHDWHMTSESATGKMTAIETSGKITEIQSMQIEMPAESLKSGKSGLDKNGYKALKTDNHKNIKFDLKNATETKPGEWMFNGTLTIAGTAKPVHLKIHQKHVSGVHTFEGQHAFKLTDYNVTPPTAMMGTVKTGNEVKIFFKVSFK